MIVTVTPNPALDRAIVLDAPLATGAVQRANGERQDAGGKGINVSRALAAAGVDTVALFPAAASDPFIALVEESGVTARPVPVDGRVRSNITLVDPEGTTTKINLPGDESVAEAADEIIAAIVQASAGANWLVLAGSFPPGLGNDFFARVIRTVRTHGGPDAPRIAVDTSGPPLAGAMEAHPDLIKPNGSELAELLGEEAGDDAEHPGVALERARRIVPSRAAAALVTLGSRGAVYVDETTSLFAPAPQITVRSTVGAGDSSLAGFLIPNDGSSADRLASAVSYGAAAASLPGTQTPTPTDANMTVTVTDWTAGPPAGL